MESSDTSSSWLRSGKELGVILFFHFMLAHCFLVAVGRDNLPETVVETHRYGWEIGEVKETSCV